MKEKFEMTTFMMGAFADVVSTQMAMGLGMKEVGIASRGMMESGAQSAAYALRVAVPAILIGLYALTKKHGGRWEFSLDRAMRIGNIVCWGVVALNMAQIAGAIK